MTLQFQFTVSEAWIEEQLEQTGMEMPDTWEVEFELPEVPADLRPQLIGAHRQYLHLPGYPELYAPVDNPRAFLEAISDWIRQSTAEFEREQATSQMLQAAEARMTRAFDEERDAWIAEYGSERLRAASSRGYKVNRSYAIERAAAEYPHFWVDTSGEADLRERTDPTTEALNVEEAVKTLMSARELDNGEGGPRIVWLVEATKELEDFAEANDWMIEQQEAILVPAFLGRYSLILPIDTDLHRPIDSEVS
jgi:hypothetical protein